MSTNHEVSAEVFVRLPSQEIVTLHIDHSKSAKSLAENSHVLGESILALLATKVGWSHDDLSQICYLTCEGYLVKPEQHIKDHQTFRLQCRVLGGKGGFGSLLRSFGKKRVKTKNRNMCRDLSGRRVRDVQTEKRLKDWAKTVGSTSTSSAKVQKQTAKDNRIKRIREKLEGTDGKHLLNDPEWSRERHRIPDFIHDAVRDGVKVASSKLIHIADAVVGKVNSSDAELVHVSDQEITTMTAEKRAVTDDMSLRKNKISPVAANISSFVRPRTSIKETKSISSSEKLADDVDGRNLRKWCGLGNDYADDSDDDSVMSETLTNDRPRRIVAKRA